MVKAFVFDLDGTLVDTLADIASVVNDFLTSKGWPCHPTQNYKRMVGDGFPALMRRALPECALSQFNELYNEALAAYTKRGAGNSKPYAGAAETLRYLYEKNIPMAVVSNKPDALVHEIVPALFPDIRFAFLSGGVDGKPKKPDPFFALRAAEACGTAPEHCAYVGDSDVDMLTALNAGMLPVGAAWGFRSADELSKAGAKLIAESWADIALLA